LTDARGILKSDVVENNEDIPRLVEVARMYYEQDLTQSEIAKALRVSRPLVGRMLSRARELGIVNIEIRSPLQGNKQLRDLVLKRYGVADALIVPANRSNLELSLRNVVSQAAIFAEKTLSRWQILGLGWGSTVSRLVDILGARELGQGRRRSICPLIGPMTSPSIDWHPNELVRRLAERLNAEAVWIHAPAFPGTEENRQRFIETEEWRLVESRWRELDAAIVEIEAYPSVPDQATAMRFGDMLHERQAVGGMLSYFFDINGNVIEGENDFVVRMPLEFLRRVEKVLLVCSGNVKPQALIGALRLGLVTHLVTDDVTASSVLEYEG
jgi:deoxyribonucleoside regulator